MAGFGKKAASTTDDSSPLAIVDGKCLCNSESLFESCCEPHIKSGGKGSSPEAVIRSRYSAYKLDKLDHIIETTSSQCTDYLYWFEQTADKEKAVRNWKRNIKKTMINGYVLVKCEIDEVGEEKDGKVDVVWRHLAIGTADNIMYPVKETTTLVKEGPDDAWKYLKCEVSRPLSEDSQTMMQKWPLSMGMKQKLQDPKALNDYEKWKQETYKDEYESQ